jgi:hypothetical protein
VGSPEACRVGAGAACTESGMAEAATNSMREIRRILEALILFYFSLSSYSVDSAGWRRERDSNPRGP